MAESPLRAGPTLLTVAATSQTILTAGAASTWFIVREIVVVNETAAAVAVTIGVGTTNTDAAGKRILKSQTIQPNDIWTWGGFIPLAGHASTPDLLYALTDTTNGATVTVGYVSGP